MLVACTACHSRFEAGGYRDVLCPTCGAVAQPRPCPRCSLPLSQRNIHDLVLDECTQCRGLFLDTVAKKRLAEQDVDRAEALFAALSTDAGDTPARSYDQPSLQCPVCGVAMERKLSSTGAGVVIDICKLHGTFYDGGELRRLLAFAQRGAQYKAEVARQREADARRIAADERREREERGTLRGTDWMELDIIRLLLGE